jgi:hypothetical protein
VLGPSGNAAAIGSCFGSCCDVSTSHRAGAAAHDGTLFIAERFAIDFVQIGAAARLLVRPGNERTVAGPGLISPKAASTDAENARYSFVPWREVVLFTSIAYGLTWAWQGIWIVPNIGRLLAAPTTPHDATLVFGNQVNHLPGMFGPLLAAVAMRRWVGREGVRGSLGLRRSWRLYASAIFGPMLLVAAAGMAMVHTDVAPVAASRDTFAVGGLIVLAVLLVPESLLAIGEEYGWRGYLLPRLLPLGEVRATLLIGLVWGLWHLPLVVAGVLLGGYSLWLVLPIHLSVVVLLAFPFTWLAKATSFSPAVAAAFHGSMNWAQQRLFGLLVVGNLLAAIAVIDLAWLLVVLLVYGHRWLRARRPV